jgi:hypothetical protein
VPASQTCACTTCATKDVALSQKFPGDRDIKSAMRYVNSDGKEASRLTRLRKV